MHISLQKYEAFLTGRERETENRVSWIESRKRLLSSQSWKSRRERELILKIFQIEKRKRFVVKKSWKSRREREMKIQFSSSREKNMSHFFSRFSRDRDSCQWLVDNIFPRHLAMLPYRRICQWFWSSTTSITHYRHYHPFPRRLRLRGNTDFHCGKPGYFLLHQTLFVTGGWRHL